MLKIKMLKKSITIIVCFFIAGWIYSAIVWMAWGKPGGIIFGAIIAPIICAKVTYFFTIPIVSISVILTVYGCKKNNAKPAIAGSTTIGILWVLMVVLANSRAFLD